MQTEEYYEFIKWAKKNDPTIYNLTNNNVKFIEFLLHNRLGTHRYLFESVKKYQMGKESRHSKYWIIRKIKHIWAIITRKH